MSIKISFFLLASLAIFVAKISFENFYQNDNAQVKVRTSGTQNVKAISTDW